MAIVDPPAAPHRWCCYVISLERSTARRQAISVALDALDVPYTFDDAVDAQGGLDPATEAEIERAPNNRISDSEFACALSHRRACERFLASDYEQLLVLEDDAIPSPALQRYLFDGHIARLPMALLYHERAHVHRRAGVPLFDDIVAYPLAFRCTHAVAYSVNRDVARRLVEAQIPVRRTADWPIELETVQAHVLWPRIVDHPPKGTIESNISEARESTRHLRRRANRFFSARYYRRRLRKALSTRIS